MVDLRDATVAALHDSGHEVAILDPYRDGFEAAMSLEELRSSVGGNPPLDPIVRRYAENVGEATTLAFVFPMWWSGPPSMLKGFFDRVFVSGVAFSITDNGRIHPGLRHVQNVCIVTAAETPGHFPHRSTRHLALRFARSLRRATGRKTKAVVEWAGPGIRGNTQAESDFLDHVRQKVSQRTSGTSR